MSEDSRLEFTEEQAVDLLDAIAYGITKDWFDQSYDVVTYAEGPIQDDISWGIVGRAVGVFTLQAIALISTNRLQDVQAYVACYMFELMHE